MRRVRVKDAVNTLWWLSKTPWPKADNRRVLQPYSDAMKALLRNGYRTMKRPSGHEISEHFAKNNGAAIPPNLIALPNTESNSRYLRYCQEEGVAPHPARFPADLPQYFIRMLTDEGDLVVDPFAGSCVTAEVCERLSRRWLCGELEEEYLRGALGRFDDPGPNGRSSTSRDWYRVPRPGLLWDAPGKPEPLAQDGGRGYRRRRHTLRRSPGQAESEQSARRPIGGVV